MNAPSAAIVPAAAEAPVAPPSAPLERVPMWYRPVMVASAAACAYHGYRRNGSVWWALAWGLFGTALPILAVPVALAQGFGRPAKRSNPRRRRRRR